MKKKFEERWGTGLNGTVFIENQSRGYRRIRKGVPNVAFIAAYIDPRTKLLTGIPSQDQGMVKDLVKQELLNELAAMKLEEVEQKSQTPILPSSTTISRTESYDFDIFAPLREDAENQDVVQREEADETIVNDEMHDYLRLKPLPHTREKFGDPLEWWQERENQLPLHARLAKRTLNITATSSESERIFSTAGNTVTKKRSRMHPDTVCGVVVLHDSWLTIENFKRRKLT